ncbi:MAG: CRISPR-associated endonuclease Cas3'' [Halieaceae bacterium]|nr:CRISPR-associated endonuclease Cas3'' [Halieaceae bacterium]
MTTPAYTRHFWAKSDRDNKQRIHLLEHHMADVGACLEALLAQPTIRRRLARSGGGGDPGEANSARLCVFAALHDIGKVNVGFQTRIWDVEDLPTGGRIPATGHIADLAPVLYKRDRQTAKWLLKALQWNEIEKWDDKEGETVRSLFLASLSHHGRPFQLNDPAKDKNTRVWQPLGQLEPQRFVEHAGQLIRHWFPQAFRHDACPLPSAPSFQHHFLGLCNLADWIGSNES